MLWKTGILPMTIEVEFKAWVDDPSAFKAKLDAQAAFVGEVQKHDIYFRQPGDSEGHFRLRREGQTSTVTTKYKRIVDGTEISDEIEFEVSEAGAFCRLADRFGFEPFVIKRKASRVYRVGTTTLELNEVEHLGFFIEVEMLCEDESQVEGARKELAAWADRLGIPDEAIEPRPYIRLIRERHPARYIFAHDDPVALVHEKPMGEVGRQEPLL
jgi:predicted adenylyl cyclase CyaB